MNDEFQALDFKITGGNTIVLETLLGMAVEQNDKSIKIHLDNYVKEAVAEYSDYVREYSRPKKVLISPGIAFKTENYPEIRFNFPIRLNSCTIARLSQSFSLWQHGSNSIFRSRYRSWHASVHGQDRLSGQHSTIPWNILQATPP